MSTRVAGCVATKIYRLRDFFHRHPYPILDYRALWSLSLKLPKCYSFEFWWAYVEYCRELSSRNGVDMRTLDKALWQYSKEKQK